MSNLLYADSLFADCEIAIQTLCLGCPDERGWSFANEEIPEPIGNACCEHMVNDVTNCEHPCVFIRDDGKPYCVFRYRRFDLPEIEKYQKRLRGDWS